MSSDEDRHPRWRAALGGLLDVAADDPRGAYRRCAVAAGRLVAAVRAAGVPLSLAGAGPATVLRPLADLPFAAGSGGGDGVGLDLADPDALLHRYHAEVPRALRRATGAFHTPAWLAERALAELDEAVVRGGRILDPGCGSGSFLAAARRARLDGGGGAAAVERLLRDVRGVDVDPLAVLFARLDLALDLHRRGLLPTGDAPTPVRWADSVLGVAHGDPGLPGTADALVGNPPWLPWSALARGYRDAIRATLATGAAVFDRTGFEARLGHANDDLLSTFTLATAARHLRPGGVLALVVKRGLLGNVAGSGFRRRTLAGGGEDRDPLGVTRVLDLTALGPIFEDAREPAVVLVARRGSATRFPVPWVRCRARRDAGRDEVLHAVARSADPGAAWDVVGPDHRATAWLEGAGAHAAEIRHGLKHDAEGVFALEITGTAGPLVSVRNRPRRGTRGGVSEVTATIEPDRLFPYVKCRHLRPWGARGHAAVLVPHDGAGGGDPAELRRRLPRTWAYLERFRPVLEARRSTVFAGGPFTAQFAVGPYSWRRYRVAWCSMAPAPAFAVLAPPAEGPLAGKPVVVDGACYAIATDDADEAHALCALLGSAVARRFLEARRGQGKRWLGKTNVARLALPALDPADPDVRALAGASRRAHRRAAAGDDAGLAGAQAALDRLAEAFLRRRRP